MTDFVSTSTPFSSTMEGGTDNSSTVINVDEYLTTYLGQRYRGTVAAVSLSIVYSLVLMTGVLGNDWRPWQRDDVRRDCS